MIVAGSCYLDGDRMEKLITVDTLRPAKSAKISGAVGSKVFSYLYLEARSSSLAFT